MARIGWKEGLCAGDGQLGYCAIYYLVGQHPQEQQDITVFEKKQRALIHFALAFAPLRSNHQPALTQKFVLRSL